MVIPASLRTTSLALLAWGALLLCGTGCLATDVRAPLPQPQLPRSADGRHYPLVPTTAAAIHPIDVTCSGTTTETTVYAKRTQCAINECGIGVILTISKESTST